MEASVLPWTALGAGVLTFVSPCILPLLPAYIGFMAGSAASGTADGGSRRGHVLRQSLLFVAGFTVVFVALGVSASLLGGVLDGLGDVLDIVAGVVLILLGVLMSGVIRLPWLYADARIDLTKARRFGSWSSLVMGMAFAFGWSPCVGPILGAILMMAADSARASTGALLLVLYSIGLGVPFVVVGLLLDRLGGLLAWLKRHSLVINRIAAAVLILVGLLILVGRMDDVAGWLTVLFA